MKKATIYNTLESFTHNILFYMDLIEEIKKNNLDITYKYEIVEGIATKILAEWESFGKNLLIDSLHRDTSNYSKNYGFNIPKHLPRSVCHGLINGIGFFDIRGYEDLKKLSKKVVIDKYNPFLIDKNKIKDEIGYIDDFYIFRNLIAHNSLKGYMSYKKRLSQKYGYSRIHKPGKILFSKNEGKELVIDAFLLIFLSLTEEIIKKSHEKGLISDDEIQEIKKIYFIPTE